MKLILTTPERQLLNDDSVEKIVVPTLDGEITIMSKHIALISSLGRGELTVFYKTKPEELYFVSGGVLQIFSDEITILANLAERAQEIDEAAIEESIRRAKETALEEKTVINIAEIQAKLSNDLVRLKLASKYKSKRNR